MTRPFDVLRSLAFYAAFALGSVYYVLASLAVVGLSARLFRWFVHGWSAHHLRCARLFLGIRLQLEGKVPSGPVLVAIKHESMFEAVDMPRLLDHPGVFAKAELLRIPLWGRVGERFGLIGVERDQGARALRTMVARAREISAEGRPLAIFPEGTRIPHGTRAPLQAGFAGLYKLLALPVVPIAINSGPLYHRRWKRPGTITARIGETIPPGLPREEIEARVTAAINALNPVSPT
jgi:1-acyl-sn-glycerol-3-phosphate acyltransferase